MNPVQQAIHEYDKGQKTFGEVLKVYKENQCKHKNTVPTRVDDVSLCCDCGEFLEAI